MNFQPVYLQTSASQLAYCVSKSYWTNNKFTSDAYSAGNVSAYAARIQQKCSWASLESITGVTPLSANPAGGTTNWEYIPKDVRSTYGVPANANLQTSVGSSDGDAGYDGSTKIGWLAPPMRSILDSRLAKIKGPLLSVIDHNAGHHMAAALVDRAFHRPAKDKIVRILLNFDFHTDFGAVPQNAESIIKCSTWAGFMTCTIKDVYGWPTVDAYVNLGRSSAGGGKVDGDLAGGVVCYSTRPGPPQPIGAHVDPEHDSVAAQVAGQLHAVLDALKMANPGATVQAYISVDRDFMKGSATPWGDGPQSPANGRTAIASAFKFFKDSKVQLMGADICGLPSVGGNRTGQTPQEALDQAYEDIVHLSRQMTDD